MRGKHSWCIIRRLRRSIIGALIDGPFTGFRKLQKLQGYGRLNTDEGRRGSGIRLRGSDISFRALCVPVTNLVADPTPGS